MTKEETIKRHRKIWNWLADNPGKTKKDYFNEFDTELVLECCCYLCDYVIKRKMSCDNCPIKWPHPSCNFEGQGLCNDWEFAILSQDNTLAAKVARRIANLPEREEIKC